MVARVIELSLDPSQAIAGLGRLEGKAAALENSIRQNVARGFKIPVEVNDRTGRPTARGQERIDTEVNRVVGQSRRDVFGRSNSALDNDSARVIQEARIQLTRQATVLAATNAQYERLGEALLVTDQQLRLQGRANAAATANRQIASASEKEALAANQAYIQSRVQAAVATLELSAKEKELSATSGVARAARVRDAVATEQLSAQKAQELLNSRNFIATKAQAAVVNKTLADQTAAEAAERATTSAPAAAARVRLLVADQELAALKSEEALGSTAARAAKVRETVASLEFAALKQNEVNQALLDNPRARFAKINAAISQELLNTTIRREAEASITLAGLKEREAAQVLSRLGVGGGGGNRPGGAGPADGGLGLAGGFRSVLRFALPSAALFGTARAISSIIKEAEELIQVQIRLENQFGNLAATGAFDSLIAEGEEVNEVTRQIAASDALSNLQDDLKGVARETGVGTEQIFKLSSSFVGLFSSLGASGTALTDFASNGAEIAAQLGVITGLSSAEAFNDLAGAVRAFSDNGPEADALLESLSNNIISVADSSGVASNELLDFVGRIAPIAEAAGFSLEELNAVGATLLQGSGIGGAALAEQFGRIISTFGDNIDEELARVSIEVPELGLDLDDITSGNVQAVLTDLIDGFDNLSDAQQRQVIASLGSRREGNTLATLLQGVSTFQGALAAQTDSTGERLRRFQEIQKTLTVEVNQLKVAFEQFGQVLLNAGLGSVLLALLEAFQAIAGALEFTAKGIGLVTQVLDVFPESMRGVITVIGLAVAAIKLYNLNTSIAAKNTLAFNAAAASSTGAVTGTLTGVRGGADSLAKFGRAARVAGTAALVAGAAFEVFTIGQNFLNAASEETEERQKALAESLRNSGNEYVDAADKAKDYVEQLRAIRDAQDVGEGEGAVDGPGGGGGRLVGSATALADRINASAEQASILDRLNEEFGVNIEDLRNAALEQPELFREVDLAIRQSSGQGGRALESVADAIEEIGDLGVLGPILSDFIDSNPSEGALKNMREFLNNVATFATDLGDTFEAQEAEARSQLRDIVTLNDDTTTQEIAALIIEETLLGRDREAAASAVRDALLEEGRGVPDSGLEEAEEKALESLASARALFEADLISLDQFNAAAEPELETLLQILESVLAGGDGEDAADKIKKIREIETLQSKAVTKRFDQLRENAEFLGVEVPLEDFAALVRDPDIRDDPEALENATRNLREATRDFLINLANEADDLEKARILENPADFLPPGIIDATNIGIVESNIVDIGNILNFKNASQDQIDNDVNQIIGFLNEVDTLEEAVRLFLLAKLAELEVAITSSPEAAAALGAEAERIRSLLDQASLDLPEVASAGAGFNPEGILDAAEESISAFEKILDEISETQSVLGRLNQDRTPEALGQRAAALANLLRSGGGTDDERLEAALLIAEAFQAIDELEADEIITAQNIINQLTGGIDAQQLASTEIIFAALSNQANAFNQFASEYLARGSVVMSGLIGGMSELIARGASLAQALAAIISSQVSTINAEIAALEITLFKRGPGAAASQAQLDVLRNELVALDQLSANQSAAPFQNFVAADFGAGAGGFSGGGGGGGGGSDEEDDLQARIAQARLARRRARRARDPLALARIDQFAANLAIQNARDRAERIEAKAQLIEADDAFADALRDIFNAEFELARVVAEQAGDIEEALDIGVRQARENSDFLEEEGAGRAERLNAEAEVLLAEAQQREGLLNQDLEDLDFLNQIGDLTTNQYIASLQSILRTLDPIADRDIFREVTLLIQDLQNRTNDAANLQFNLPSGDFLPSVFAARRLQQFGTLDTQLGAPSAIDNRTVNIEILVTDSGPSWEEAIDAIQGAAGNPRTFSADVRRY